MAGWFKHKLVISRSLWRCGSNGRYNHGKLMTSMIDAMGMMCCLGQDAKACGVSEANLLNRANPDSVCVKDFTEAKKIPHLVKIDPIDGRYTGSHTEFANEAISINDNESFNDRRRELELFLLGKKHGIFIQFVGEYEKQ